MKERQRERECELDKREQATLPDHVCVFVCVREREDMQVQDEGERL